MLHCEVDTSRGCRSRDETGVESVVCGVKVGDLVLLACELC